MMKNILAMFKREKTVFEKVSFPQFEKDMIKLYPNARPFDIKNAYSRIKIPKRATHGSCGYDIVTPIDVSIKNGEEMIVPLGIRCKMKNNQLLLLAPRSGIGFKTGVTLANTVGVIDSDYYYADNEGHIMAKLVGGFDELKLIAGEKFLQGIFLNYDITDDDVTVESRTGGFGSTGK